MTTKNFVWLTFDSIRGDRTSVGGHHRDTTPTLSAVGSRQDGNAGTCFSHGIWSQPSVASMMTGTYPSTHGSGSQNETLPTEIPTVAERLSEAGYDTIGVSSNPFFSESTGTARGFDSFDSVSGAGLAREAGPRGLLSFLRNIRTFSGGVTLDKEKHTPDYLLNEIVKDRLERQSKTSKPFFLAAHYYGAHHPYYPSPAFREKFASALSVSGDEAAEIVFERTKDVYSTLAHGSFDSEPLREAVEAMYDAQLVQVDRLIGELLSYIDSLEIGEDTIVVMTSDHGDLLGELDLCSHKLVLHDALMEVPIAVRGSESLTGIEFGLAQHSDIMKTILAELGADTEGIQGKRLDRTSRETAYAQRGPETYQKTLAEIESHNPEFDNDHIFSGFVTAARTEKWKYVSGENETALYQLPTENEDVKSTNPERTDRFKKRLAEWLAAQGETEESTAEAEFDDAVQDRLSDLGYIVD